MNISIENIKDITFGAESIEEENDYIVFPRFTENEKKVYTDSSDLKIKTLATAGVRLDFYDFEFTDKFSKSLKKGRKRITIFFLTYLICKLKTSN